MRVFISVVKEPSSMAERHFMNATFFGSNPKGDTIMLDAETYEVIAKKYSSLKHQLIAENNKFIEGLQQKIINFKYTVEAIKTGLTDNQKYEILEKLEKFVSERIPNFAELKRIRDELIPITTGIQNVYDKFIEIEKRQIEIEALLKNERIAHLTE